MSIELVGLAKSFGSKTVVQDLTLSVPDGSFLVLLGPSGCGKTTTLRMIAGLEEPDAGAILIDGRDVTAKPPRDRGLAMVFQDYGLYPHMSAYENVAFPLRIAKCSREETTQRVNEIMERMGIGHLANRKPGTASGGEMQRIALARALVRRPKNLLMDEPLSNLDALLRASMRTEIKLIHQSLGMTTVYVTHDQVEALSLGSLVAVMRDGRLEQCGGPMEIYERPATRFVARFVGSPAMNLLEVSARAEGGKCYLVGHGYRVALAELGVDPAQPWLDGRPLVLGVRPSHITLTRDSGGHGIMGEAKVVELLGEDNIVHVGVGDEMVRVRVHADEWYEPGQKVALAFSHDGLHFYEHGHEGGRLN